MTNSELAKYRVICIDDEPHSEQIVDFVNALRKNGFHVGPTPGYQEKYDPPLVNGVFDDVDEVVRYLNRIETIPEEWAEIDGFIIDVLMPPGNALSEEYSVLKDGGIMHIGRHLDTGIYLTEYISQNAIKNKLWQESDRQNNKHGRKVVLLTNLNDVVFALDEAFRRMKDVAFIDRGRNDREIIESGIEIHYHSKRDGTDEFVKNFREWLHGDKSAKRTFPENAQHKCDDIARMHDSIIRDIERLPGRKSAYLNEQVRLIKDRGFLKELWEFIVTCGSVDEVELAIRNKPENHE